MKKIFLAFFAVFIVYSCVYDPPYEKISINNKSSLAICAMYSCYEDITIEDLLNFKLMDTVFSKVDGEEHVYKFPSCCPPNSIGVGGLYNRSWKNFIENCDSKTIKIFFFEEETLEREKRKNTVKNRNYLKKIELSLKEIKEKNGRLSFWNKVGFLEFQ